MSVQNGAPPGVPMNIKDGENHGKNLDKNRREQYYYKQTDHGPFKVMVEKIFNESTSGERKIGINKIAVGVILQQNGFGKTILDIKKAAFTKVTVYVDNWKEANRLVNCQNLLLKNLKAYIPKGYISVKGVINGVPEELTMDEIMPHIDDQVEIMEMFRMTRKTSDGNRLPTRKIGIVFRSNTLPEIVRVFRVLTKVEPFVTRVVQCEKCLRYGHTTTNCKSSTPRCANCAEKHEGQCVKETRCAHCKGEHNSMDPQCPERIKQKNIKTLMAKRNITYQEAWQYCKIETTNGYSILQNIDSFPTPYESFVDAVKAKPDIHRNPAKLSVKKNNQENQPQPPKQPKIRYEHNEEKENNLDSRSGEAPRAVQNKKRKPSEPEETDHITVQRYIELRQRWEEQMKKTAYQKDQLTHALVTTFNKITALLTGNHENGYAILQEMQNDLGQSLGLNAASNNTPLVNDGQVSDIAE